MNIQRTLRDLVKPMTSVLLVRHIHMTNRVLQNRFQRLVAESKKKIKEQHPTDIKKEIDSGVSLTLVDVREGDEWRKSRIGLPNVVHLSKGVLEREIEKLVAEPEAKIVVYCAGGVRSVLAAENLQRMGYQNVISMSGGIAEWQRAGLPVDQTTK